MAYGINVVAIVGNLTRDPELKHAGETTIAELGVAVNGSEKKGGEWQERADFFDVTVFGNRASSCAEYLSKGSSVAISGRLRQDRWTNDNGDNRSKVKIIADQVKFLGSKDGESDSGGGGFGAPVQEAPANTSDAGSDEDEIPF